MPSSTHKEMKIQWRAGQILNVDVEGKHEQNQTKIFTEHKYKISLYLNIGMKINFYLKNSRLRGNILNPWNSWKMTERM